MSWRAEPERQFARYSVFLPGYPSEPADHIGYRARSCRITLPTCAADLAVAMPEGRRSRYKLADLRMGQPLDHLVGLVLAVDPPGARAAIDSGSLMAFETRHLLCSCAHCQQAAWNSTVVLARRIEPSREWA